MPVPEKDDHLHGTYGDGSGRWDAFAGSNQLEHSSDEFGPSNASEAQYLNMASGVPQNKFTKFYNYLLDVSVVTRRLLFIVLVLGLLWIPGIVGFTVAPEATVWGVKLLWWSIWLSVVWGGWWASLAASMILPLLARHTVGTVAVGTRKYIDWIAVLRRYVAFASWTLACWIAFQPLINTRQEQDASQSDQHAVDLLAKLLFAFFLCAAILFGEKFVIQWIAGKFHERSYAERIADQKFAIQVLSTLYRYSHDTPGRSDALTDCHPEKKPSIAPKRLFKHALKGVKVAATTTTTALGAVASEIAGSSVLQPNSPQAVVQIALESVNNSRLLARRLFYSFAKPGSEYFDVKDIRKFFPTLDDADAAFAIFDRDDNGNVTRDEFEMACLEFHREQLSIEHSMTDLDSAVGRLDNILMSLYVVVSILIIAVALEAQLVTLITGAGTLFLGLSWLIGPSLSEVLTSIIFLFVKHPYDVGDRVQVGKDTYVVKEIRLLSTIFLDDNSCLIQAPNITLSPQLIMNMRRSPQMSESFTFDVAYSTSYEQIQQLRELMLKFVTDARRDYQPSFDVAIVDIPEQKQLTLKADIKYKSNWQHGALKAQRRNKWIYNLKISLARAHIFGPNGDPGAKKPPTPVTMVPWEDVRHEEKMKQHQETQQQSISQTFTFADQDAVMLDDTEKVFGGRNELDIRDSRQIQTPSDLQPRTTPFPTPGVPTALRPSGFEEFELATPQRDRSPLPPA
ncbi:uncharacterized protein PHACADRAFT_258317 [Phanerochaete carnosa HHB-10118-sp]|uniref:Mechanosensitive ion channel protein n=1 Tax=Phanerochaete carnosa (strain HHB-10118-sp) TaxID=650164 RepID=K5VSJ6_PHACS|nr:uncharacterized protein PHACADRAFT_258317 [Phanerochaete carnosa HHB-10118-sp]EKM54463.1 hypothetical protein PHACADRAFT_258317 [Phanerochaete carnosa HHB-10118-sp]